MSALDERTAARDLRRSILDVLIGHGPHALGALAHRLAVPPGEVRAAMLALIAGGGIVRVESQEHGVRYAAGGRGRRAVV